VLKQLRYQRRARPWAKGDEDVQRAITYFANQGGAGRMDYASRVAAKEPIGSGVTEAACTVIVKQRLCNSGMQWKEPGAAAVLSLRCLSHTPERWGRSGRRSTAGASRSPPNGGRLLIQGRRMRPPRVKMTVWRMMCLVAIVAFSLAIADAVRMSMRSAGYRREAESAARMERRCREIDAMDSAKSLSHKGNNRGVTNVVVV
jgi:hypothetical protein